MTPIIAIGVTCHHLFAHGDDLLEILGEELRNLEWPEGAVGMSDGDIVVISSKVIAKIEGRTEQAVSREEWITHDAVRVLATKETPHGITRIVQTSHGFVLAAAGVDESNTEPATIVRLPADPDASAALLRERLFREFSCNVGVIVADTMGRAWRMGVTDQAIGASGVRVLDDHADRTDAFGRPLRTTVVAVADEIAGLANLVAPKDSLTPVVVVRGLAHCVIDTADTARELVRPLAEDLFSQGTREAFAEGRMNAVSQRRTVRSFLDTPVPDALIDELIADAITAPAPHHSTPWRFLVSERDDKRAALLDVMREQWRVDLQNTPSIPPDQIETRLSRGDILRTAPVVIFPFIDLEAGAHAYPDHQRTQYERDMFMVSGGAAVENLLISASARGLGAAWIGSTLFCPTVVRQHLALPQSWQPLGAIALGFPAQEPRERTLRDVADFRL